MKGYRETHVHVRSFKNFFCLFCNYRLGEGCRGACASHIIVYLVYATYVTSTIIYMLSCTHVVGLQLLVKNA